jgi:uncharacterized damage-inducible protein DinB
MINDFITEYKSYKKLGQKTFDQLSDEELNITGGADNNSVAMIVRHITGNLISRFTDFLTSDGEKPWRNRDSEFIEQSYSRSQIQEMWDKAWSLLETQLTALQESDLQKEIQIRNESMTVHRALCRSLAHTSMHVGQIVLMGRVIRKENWQWLTIPKKKPDV